MKRFVKIISTIIALILTSTIGLAIVFAIDCIVKKYQYLKDPSPAASEGLGRLTDLLDSPFTKIEMVILIAAIVVYVIEIVLLIRTLVKAIKGDSFAGFCDFSVLGLCVLIFNTLLFELVIPAISGVSGDVTSGETDTVLLIYLVALILTVYDMLVSRMGVKGKTCERILTVSCCIFIFVGGLGSMLFFVNGRPLGGVISSGICFMAIVVLAVKILKDNKGL
ncbi:MAG: hypothetical protein IK014_08135 [Lachnospiraceae bacterium]|nr:hypothetical protein [Lachnospiraceae bacterium]